jgi:two-component system sensor kinase FixL
MSWVTVVWSMMASACLTLAALYALVWLRDRAAWPALFFAVIAVSTTVFSLCELRAMQVATPDELGAVMRWMHVPLLVLTAAIAWFVHLFLRAGRRWLVWTVCVARAFSLLLNFTTGQNLNYQEITAIDHIVFLGEPVVISDGVTNPWMAVGQLSGLLLIVFVADASLTAWRRGDRRKALTVGGAIVGFLVVSMIQTGLVFWTDLRSPVTMSPFFMGLVGAMGYELSRDVLRASQLVRELQTTEASLRESEARMSLAVDAAGLGIWHRDLVRNEIWANGRWRTLLGFPASMPLEFDEVLQRLHPDDRDKLRRAHQTALLGMDGSGYYTEYRVMLPDGETRWIASQGRVECDATGQPILIRGAVRDVTARKLAEQEALVLRQEISHAGRVSMMGQLASALAHEINQPLGAILRNTEAAELFLRHEAPDLDEIRAILADIRSDDERAGAVIDRMRALLQRHSLEARRLDVRDLIGDVAALVRVDAEARHIRLDVDVADEVPPIRGDRVHLQQVLLNLVLNGMDALNPTNRDARGVAISARTSGAGTVELAVEDVGDGIPAGAFLRLFDPFFTTKPQGMGMGLAISRTIIEAHGGRIWAENRTSGGAAFRFTLPAWEKGV